MKAVYTKSDNADTQYFAGEYIGTLTNKGQFTLPAPIRAFLHVKGYNKIAFTVSEGKVVVKQPSRLSLEDTFGAVTPMNQPEDFTALRDTAIAEHIERNAGL